MTVKRWPMRLPNDDRVLDVIGTTYDIAARRFKRAFGVEPINAEILPELMQEEVFKYLDRVRDGGNINMHGAARFVHRNYGEVFDLQPGDSEKLLSEWMRTFAERHPEEN